MNLTEPQPIHDVVEGDARPEGPAREELATGAAALEASMLQA